MNDKAARALRPIVKGRYALAMVLRAYPTHRDRGLLRTAAVAAQRDAELTGGDARERIRLRPAAVLWAHAGNRKSERMEERRLRRVAASRDIARRTIRLARRQAKRLAYLDTINAARQAEHDRQSPSVAADLGYVES